jgi:hypothetical protein
MLSQQPCLEQQTSCKQTERALNETGHPAPHDVILDLLRTFEEGFSFRAVHWANKRCLMRRQRNAILVNPPPGCC